MKKRGKSRPAAAAAPRASTARSRQRQRLIDACISALHLYGPSRTTVEKVVAIAKMSPGIVRFYFDSKAAMLVASLQFLSAEFEEQVLVPVARLTARPVAALELLVDLYLDPDIASARKVSVWYAFWGEASSRQEYYDICGQKDEGFTLLVRELIGNLIRHSGRRELDPDGIALGLIGVLEILWQDIAFQTEDNIDRDAAKRRCMAFLRSVFPGEFPVSNGAVAADGVDESVGPRIAGWTYDSPELLMREQRQIFDDVWMLAGHAAQLPAAGDFVTADTGVERVLLLRDGAGISRALRNSCPVQPHRLVDEAGGRLAQIQCPAHDLHFRLDGSGIESNSGDPVPSLHALDVRDIGGLLFVRSARASTAAEPPLGELLEELSTAELRPLRRPADRGVRADWKIVVERWLAGDRVDAVSRPTAKAPGWSGRAYARASGDMPVVLTRRRFVAPNQLFESRTDGVSIFQVVPTSAGRCQVQRFDLTRCASARVAQVLRYLAGRMSGETRRASIALAESVQDGIVHFGYPTGPASAATQAFWKSLAARIPLMALSQAPDGL